MKAKINFKVRFNKENRTFILRFIAALIIPVLTYFGLKFEDLTTWEKVGELIIEVISNPFVVGMLIVNALNMIPDPTTAGIGDSERALSYESPNKGE